jgi:hypothetical protein
MTPARDFARLDLSQACGFRRPKLVATGRALLRLVKSVARFFQPLEKKVGTAKQRHVAAEVIMALVADLISEGIPH